MALLVSAAFFDQFMVIFDLKAEEIELIPYEFPAARR